MWTIFPCAFIIILHLVRTTYLFNLASWKLVLFGIFFPSDLLQDISWGQVLFTCPLRPSFTSLLGLVTIMSPLASVLRCIYWSEPANYSLSLRLSFLVTMSFFSKSVRLFLFCKDVCLHPHLDSTGSDALGLSFSFTSLSMSISSFFPVAGNGIISSFFRSECRCIVCTYPIFCLHPSVLACVSCLVIAPSAAMIIGCGRLFKFLFSLDLCLGMGLRVTGHFCV